MCCDVCLDTCILHLHKQGQGTLPRQPAFIPGTTAWLGLLVLLVLRVSRRHPLWAVGAHRIAAAPRDRDCDYRMTLTTSATTDYDYIYCETMPTTTSAGASSVWRMRSSKTY